MADFEYVQEDEALARSALYSYRQADRKGFLWGTFLGGSIGLLFAAPVNKLIGTRKGYLFMPLITASLM